MALTTFVSQNLGAKQYSRVREGMRFGILCAVAMIELMGVMLFIFAPQIIALFNNDPQVIQFGVSRARVCALFYCLVGFSHVASAVMRGLGKPMTPMLIMLLCWCAVRILVLFTLGQVMHDIRLCYWIYPFTWTISSIVYLFVFRKVHTELLGGANSKAL